jgi:exosortase A-associated hydrolase 2
LYVHPFAEELNKSRRAVAVAVRRFVAEGLRVLQVDLFGCGDSYGELSDASWSIWLEDLARAATWLEANRQPVSVIWGLRLGALLAVSAVERIGRDVDLLLWQPVTSGEGHLTQFFRLKSLGESMTRPGEQRSSPSALRATLRAGYPITVAGYDLTPSLCASIDERRLILPQGYRGRILWLETGRFDAAVLAPTSQRSLKELQMQGAYVAAQAIAGPAFWQTVEIEESPGLVEASLAWLRVSAAPVSRP